MAKRKRPAPRTAAGRPSTTGRGSSARAAARKTGRKATAKSTRKPARSGAGTRAASRKAAGGARKAKATRKKTGRKTTAAPRRTKATRKAAQKRTAKTSRASTPRGSSTRTAAGGRQAATKKSAPTGRTGRPSAEELRNVSGRTAPSPGRKAPATRHTSVRTGPAGGTRTKAPYSQEDLVPGPPSSLDVERPASAARTGHAEIREALEEHTETSPALTGGDVDANWETAYASGDEAPGGDHATPDQDVVEEIGQAYGVQYDDREELKGARKLEDRDRHRWELDPASSEDYEDRNK